jgi:hypothetical protein
MHIDLTFLSPVSALFGALMGGCGSLFGAIYTQRWQTRLQRREKEAVKRETAYTEFVLSASSLLLQAYTRDDFAFGGDEHRTIGILNRMRLFAPPHVVMGAEAVLRAILEIALKPRIELRQLATATLSTGADPDPLLAFSEICRADLDQVRRGAV